MIDEAALLEWPYLLSLSLFRKGHNIDVMGVAVAFILHEQQLDDGLTDLRQ